MTIGRYVFAGLAALPLAAAQGAGDLAFNRDVRPLLADRCFPCHGVDRQARKAELRLDEWAGLTTARGGRAPVVPGEPDRSELVRRIESDDSDEVMPPPSSGLALTATERALLRRWVAAGAPFAAHWAFVPPVAPAVPAVRHVVRSPIDAFVGRALERRGLRPAPPADRATLIRRLSLDLCGLPPTPEEVDAFVADGAADAYDRLVDRLLASPRFGERMALVWLDAARYADTNGFHHDNVRTAWPYRDWVIAAFRHNLPYDRFVVEQLAGDLLPGATDEQRVATAFCRMHNINDEGGALDDEYRVEAVCDRIETIGTALMGLTLTCARCHDHKYDPFTQEDYYGLYAYFGSVDERGVYKNDFERARAYPARLGYRDAELRAAIAAAEERVAAAECALGEAEPAVARELAAFEAAFRRERGIEWVDAELIAATADGAEVAVEDGGVVRVVGRPVRAVTRFELETAATDLRLLRLEALVDPADPDARVGLAGNGNAVVTAITAEAVSVADPARREAIDWAWAWADHEQRNGDYGIANARTGGGEGWALDGHQRGGGRTALLLAARPFGFPGGTRVVVKVACTSRFDAHVVARTRLTLARGAGVEPADFPTVLGDWWLAGPFRAQDFDAAFATAFGPEAETAIARGRAFGGVRWRHRPDVRDGEPVPLQGELAAFYLAREIRTPVPRDLELALGSDDAIRVFLDGAEVLANKVLRGLAPDQERVRVALAPGRHLLVVKVVNNRGQAGFRARAIEEPGTPGPLAPLAMIAPGLRGAAVNAAFADAFGRARSPTFARLSAAAEARRAELAELEAREVPVLVMRELDEPAAVHVLTRGRYDTPDPARPVERRPPRALGGVLPADGPNDRLAFARWLTAPDHPLTARVHVNRIWQMLFGSGIVETAENFGQQAAWPSHLELLDWLAVRFVRSGWDQQALIREIVTSATYRRSSRVDPAAARADPGNRLLAYFPRVRLPGELVRDGALAIAGLLVERVGGPSVRPYQPAGLWREVSIGGSSNTQVFRRDDGDALYRRSLYTFWKRTSPNPQMALFGAPTREFCVVRRPSTNTPLQALVLWNDVQFVEAARVLAQRTLAEAGDEFARLTAMFRRCTSRRPSPAELGVLRRTLRAFAARYRAAPADAAALLAAGEAPRPTGRDPVELAAWTMVASTLLGLDETIVRD